MLIPIYLAAGESRTHWLHCSEYPVLSSFLFLLQNAVGEVREAQLVRADAVGAAPRVEDHSLGGDEVPQGAVVRLLAVEAAIEVEDAVHRVATVAEDVEVEEASASPRISIQCCHSSMIYTFYVLHASHFNFPISYYGPASLRVGPNKCQPPSLTRRTRLAEPPKLRYDMLTMSAVLVQAAFSFTFEYIYASSVTTCCSSFYSSQAA